MEKLGWFDKGWECMDKENYAQAKEYFEKAIAEGKTEAYCDLGNLYFNGQGVEQDYKKAFELYQKGAKAGNPWCMDNLGMCYFWGHGVETDLQKAAFYNEKAAKAGVERAMFDTGLNYERGYGVAQNIEKALFWLEKAAAENYPTAFVELGDLYFVGEYVEKDLKKSFDYYKKGVDIGDAHSKLLLSTFYEEGLVVEKDLEKAKSLTQEAFDFYYDQAVTEDEMDAQFRLGNFYFNGEPLIGIDQDFNQAVAWYEKAANNGLDHAQNNLGNMYAFGVGVGQNYEKAFYWYSQAAKRMNQEALSNVANLYYLGRGVEQDLEKAVAFHTKAANLGYANSQEVLGEMYMKGEGVEKNYRQAAYWLREACENGERSAFGPFGDCHRKGWGVDKNEKKAFELYQKGADMGDLQSKVSLAESYIEGCGTSVDFGKAYHILKSVCGDEERYREDLITMVIREDESGRMFLRNPLDEEELPHYARAYYMLATLYYSGNGTDKKTGEVIRMLRMADRLGYTNEEKTDETAEKFLNKVIQESEKEDICDTVDCYVEVREDSHKGEKYQVVLHHANGEESVVKFQGRNKFLYLLALLVGHEGKSVNGLTTRHFSYMRDDLSDMASDLRVDAKSYEEWIDEFIYAEDEAAQSMRKAEQFQTLGYCSYNPYRYSNAFSGANRAIKACCLTNEEYETFKLRSTGGRSAVTTISLDSSQIELPVSLQVYLDCLPTQKEIGSYRPKASVWLPIKE